MLGDHHCLLGGEAQLIGSLLLQTAGSEWGIGLLNPLFRLNPGHHIGFRFQLRKDLIRFLLAPHGDFLFPGLDESGSKNRLFLFSDAFHCAGFAQQGCNIPEFFRYEDLDFFLSVADHLQGRGLDPSRRQTPLHLAPEQWADLISHQPIQNPPRLLGIHQLFIHQSRVFDRILNGRFRDFVEHDPVGPLNVDTKEAGDMPGNGLSFPIRVSGQIDFISSLCFFADRFDHVTFASDGDIFGLKVFFNMNAQLAFRQVSHMSHGSNHFIFASQKFSYGLCFGR